MQRDKGFHEHVMTDLFGGMPAITSRAMFGGWGIYKNGVIFAIIADGVLYFRVDDATQPFFAAKGSRPFVYTMPNGRTMTMAYWELPEDVAVDRQELLHWIDDAVAASKRAKQHPIKRKK